MTSRTRRTLLGLTTALAVAVILLALRSTYLIQAIELKTLDARFRALRHADEADTSIVIVDVDNYSLALTRNTLGRFPWPRSTWAQVTDYLAAGGARVVAYDFDFPEPNLADLAGDSAFAASSARAGNVIQSITLQSYGDTSEMQTEFREDTAALPLLLGLGRSLSSIKPDSQSVEHPYRALLAAAKGVGVINLNADVIDGTTRRIPLWYRYRDYNFPAMGNAVALQVDPARLRDTIPFSDGAMLINWHGPYRDAARQHETYRVIPVAKIFKSYEQARAGENPELPLESLKNKIVFVGSSGSGLFEARANPFSAADPGVLIHATVADNILHRDWLRRASTFTNIMVLVLAALLAGVLVSVVSSVWASLGLALGLALALGGGAFVAFQRNLWVDLAAPVFGIFLTFAGGMAVNYVTEGRQKRQIREMFSKYVAPEYVAQIAEDPGRLHLEGRLAELTILFSDIRGFTSISEKLSPTEVIAFLNDYLDEMAEIVMQSGGTLDKFIGDAVMAFWGEPVPRADHAEAACNCALAMRDATRAIAERFEREGKPAIQVGIGVNTADVVVGNIGSLRHKLDYTAIGDGVNLASRLEGTNKEFGTTIIISEFTLAKVGDLFETRPLGGVNVKGKANEVQIYELIGRR